MTLRHLDEVKLRYGIPDVELSSAHGGTLNPSIFVGHQLVVIFLPSEESVAVGEVEDYARHASAFFDTDAWILFVTESANPSPAVLSGCHALAVDPQRFAWDAFQALFERKESLDRSKGAVFLFSRGGGLEHVWLGPGHAEDVVGELSQPNDW